MNINYNFLKRKAKFILFALLVITAISMPFLFVFSNKQEYKWEEIEYSNFLKLVEQKENFYSVFKRDDCNHCVAFIKNFKDIAQENNISVYVIDTSYMTNEQKLECIGKYNLRYVPAACYIEKGIMKNSIIGESNIEEMKNFVRDN